MQQLLGKHQLLKRSVLLGRQAQRFDKQLAQITTADPEALCQVLDTFRRLAAQGALLYQSYRPLQRGSRAFPGTGAGRTFRSATQTGAQTLICCCGGREKVIDIFLFRRHRRTDRPAIDPRRLHPDKEAAIKPGIATKSRPATGVCAELGKNRHHLFRYRL